MAVSALLDAEQQLLKHSEAPLFPSADSNIMTTLRCLANCIQTVTQQIATMKDVYECRIDALEAAVDMSAGGSPRNDGELFRRMQLLEQKVKTHQEKLTAWASTIDEQVNSHQLHSVPRTQTSVPLKFDDEADCGSVDAFHESVHPHPATTFPSTSLTELRSGGKTHPKKQLISTPVKSSRPALSNLSTNATNSPKPIKQPAARKGTELHSNNIQTSASSWDDNHRHGTIVTQLPPHPSPLQISNNNKHTSHKEITPMRPPPDDQHPIGAPEYTIASSVQRTLPQSLPPQMSHFPSRDHIQVTHTTEYSIDSPVESFTRDSLRNVSNNNQNQVAVNGVPITQPPTGRDRSRSGLEGVMLHPPPNREASQSVQLIGTPQKSVSTIQLMQPNVKVDQKQPVTDPEKLGWALHASQTIATTTTLQSEWPQLSTTPLNDDTASSVCSEMF
eukprot:TRINITY_DN36847_c0_g1_i1.p1 TRINITY_DN36847_c0_g1~~TRINITY_DN36847_c0_g1_i1.p1  ORF type:complete len:446 (+),score=81.79 TRINITY_DN36847_c0_g1_i1:53-1390(+)